MYPYRICDDGPDEIQHSEAERDVVCKPPLVGPTSDALNVGRLVEVRRIVFGAPIVIEYRGRDSVGWCNRGVWKAS
jgi:hypothetical protein